MRKLGWVIFIMLKFPYCDSLMFYFLSSYRATGETLNDSLWKKTYKKASQRQGGLQWENLKWPLWHHKGNISKTAFVGSHFLEKSKTSNRSQAWAFPGELLERTDCQKTLLVSQFCIIRDWCYYWGASQNQAICKHHFWFGHFFLSLAATGLIKESRKYAAEPVETLSGHQNCW